MMENAREKKSLCLDHALEYLDQGLSVIPLEPRGKRPLLKSWSEFQNRRPTEEEVEQWFSQWPEANIGIVTGAVSGVWVCDGDGEIGARWISENYPKTSLYVQTGRESGCHCYYRIPTGIEIPNKVAYKPKVDWRGNGGYVVAPPSIHENGRQYKWVNLPGLEGWRDLAEFDPFSFCPKERKGGNLNLDLSNLGNKPKPGAVGSRNQSLAQYVGMLVEKGIDPDLIVETALGWNSRNTPPLSEKEVLSVVKSILKTHVKNHPTAEIKIEESDHPEEAAFVAQQRTDAYPTEILQPGGMLQEMMDFIDRASAASLPLFNLGASVAFIGSLCGQRVMTETGLRTNTYFVCLGYSGTGKNAPISGLPQLAMVSNAAAMMGPTELTSAAAILKHLASRGKHVTLLCLDEIGMLLKGLKQPTSPAAEIPRILTKLFSSTDRPERKSYADEKLSFTIPYHHLSLYGASTPEEFWGSMSEGDTVNGFLARFQILESIAPAPMPKTSVDPVIPPNLITAINSLWGIKTKANPNVGNLQAADADSCPPIPHVVGKTQAALEIFAPFARRFHELKNDHRKEGAVASIYARVAENASKLGLIHTMSTKGPSAIIHGVGPESIQWGMAFAEACCTRAVEGIKENIATNEWHAWEQKVVRVIKARATEKRPGQSMREILEYTNMPTRTADEVIKSLLAKGRIFKRDQKSTRGPSTCIFCVPAEEAHG